jgi:hypothetical protein
LPREADIVALGSDEVENLLKTRLQKSLENLMFFWVGEED